MGMVLKMYEKNINIIAPNIKNGGGLELLLYLLDFLEEKYDFNVVVHLDKSLNKLISTTTKRKAIFYTNNLTKIKLFTKKMENSLYFGNLPPVVESENSVLYIHNSYLTMNFIELFQSSISFLIKYGLQQFYIKLFINNCNIVACQTETMFQLIKYKFNPNYLFKLPFFRECSNKINVEKEYDFCYISLAHPHKNHKLLFKAIRLLEKYKIKCTFAVTVEIEKTELINEIKSINSGRYVTIKNLGVIPKNRVCEIYNKSRCLVFTSLKESFGLPLIEAARLNLNIIAPDLKYVNDVIIPSISFKSNDERDLAEKIKKYLISKKNKKSELLIKNEIEQIIEKLVNR